jgi:hypothetical protein
MVTRQLLLKINKSLELDTLKLNLQKGLKCLAKAKLVSLIILMNILVEAAKTMPTDCRTLFVKGLPYSFKEDDVGDRFRRFGEIKAIRLAYNW